MQHDAGGWENTIDMTTVRIGIIGYGAWVRDAYVPALGRDKRAEIVAVAGRRESTLKKIEEDFGNTVDIHGDYEDLLGSSRVQAAMIAVPDSLHARAICAALDSGKPVFYEPPLADRRAEGPQVAKRLLAAQQITHADLELALIPAVVVASERIRKGAVGKVQSAGIRLQSAWGPEPDQDTSSINRLSVWYVHVLNVLLGATPRRVLVMDGHGIEGRRQPQSSGYFDYGDIWGELKVNTDSAEELSIRVEVTGDEGDVLIDLLSGELAMRTKRNRSWQSERLPGIEPYADWPGVHESIGAFLEAVISRTPSFANGQVVAGLHLVGMAAEESQDTGAWVGVGRIEDL